LRFSLVAVPVKAYAAIHSSAAASHGHFLHADCLQRIEYRKHCPQHGAIAADAIVRGYEYAPRQHVVVEPEEPEQLRPARDRALVLEQCVPLGEVDPSFFAGRSLHLVPDGPAAQHPYGVLADALQPAPRSAPHHESCPGLSPPASQPEARQGTWGRFRNRGVRFPAQPRTR
jgi:DNA end-binding protein Ku